MESSDGDPFDYLETHVSCYMCNGFYGSNFNEPLCGTCHLFLFPDDLSEEQPDVVLSCIKDDGNDSGNDCDCPQDNVRDNGCCSYNNGQANNPMVANNQPIRNRHRRRQPDDDEEDDGEHSSDSLTSDEEDMGGGQIFDNPPPNEDNDMLEDASPLYNFPQNDVSSLHRRLEELSCFNPSQFHHQILSTNQNCESMSSIQCLPPEVLIKVFSYLDDLSLCSVARVSSQWSTIIDSSIPSDQWRYYVSKRFPLFKSVKKITNWFSVYSKLIDNCPCYTCMQHMIQKQLPFCEEDTAWRHNRLYKEYNDLRLDPPDGIQAQPLDNKNCRWMATISGPVASPYEGGIFYLYIRIPFSYPMHPPKVKFITRIFHPNVSRHGDVGIDCIQHNWSLALTLNKVLISVQSLLTDPYCLVCMEPTIGELYQNNRLKFEDYARKWTSKYAILDNVLY